MKLTTFADICEDLTSTRSGNYKSDAVADVYRKYQSLLDTMDRTGASAVDRGDAIGVVGEEYLPSGDRFTRDEIVEVVEIFTRFVTGERFRDPERNTNFKKRRMRTVLQRVTGLSESRIQEIESEQGKTSEAVGVSIEKSQEETTQASLGDISGESSSLELDDIIDLYTQIDKLPDSEGDTQREKLVEEVLEACDTGKEAKWVSHCILGDISMYMSWKTCAKGLAAITPPTEDDYYRATALTYGDFPTVLSEYLTDGAVRDEIEIGVPFKPMLADEQELEDIDDDWTGQPKFDGARVLIHSDGEDLRIFTRNCKEITENLPEIHEAIDPNGFEFVLDGEAVGYDPETGDVLPFEKTMNRLRREHNISEVREEVEVQTWIFDCPYYGLPIDHRSFDFRYEVLGRDVAEKHLPTVHTEEWPNTEDTYWTNDLVHIAPNIDDLEVAFDTSLEADHEGIIAKDPDAEYVLERDVAWSKVKPQHDLDLIVAGYVEGTGQYARSDGPNHLGALELETADGVQIGRVGTGFSDDDRKEWSVDRRDEIIGKLITVTAEEIQKTDKGYGIRFARFQHLRDESDGEADTLERCIELLN